MLRFIIDKLGIFLERRATISDADRMLQLGDGVGVPHVVFPVATPLIVAAVFEHFAVRRRSAETRADAARAIPGAITSRSTPLIRLAVSVKYLSMSLFAECRSLRKSARRDSSARC